jgi:hypothetical protein
LGKVLEYDTSKNVESPTLSFGITENDGVVSPHPVIQRALRTAVEALTCRVVSNARKPQQLDLESESLFIIASFHQRRRRNSRSGRIQTLW